MGDSRLAACLPLARPFNWANFGLRAVSGAVLASGAVWSVWAWGPPLLWRWPFAALVAVAAVLLSWEWAAMAAPSARRRVALVTTVPILVALGLAWRGDYPLAWCVVAAAAAAIAFLMRAPGVRSADAAYGVLYIAPAAIVLLWLIATPQGPGWTLILFACAWAADICAFLVGSVLKGPKLWPRFSPNKTWAGFIGGLIGAMIASVGVAALIMRLSLAGAALIGLAAGLATMAGDLWESMLKRRFGVKDSGDLIPGHGGLMDRVDGLMFAVVAVAVARLWVRIGWAH